MSPTTKQPSQQSPLTCNTFTSTQATTLSIMKNQHEPTTEGESEEKDNGGVREKKNTATNFKRKKTPGAFRELKKLLGAQAIMLVHLASPS